jgi:predicted histone-like DNA-binding protein
MSLKNYCNMLKLKAIPRVNPLDRTADPKYYLKTVAKDKVDVDRMATIISRESTLSEIDCKSVILGLAVHLIDQLEQGRTVSLGDLGTFTVGVSSEGVATEEALHVGLLTHKRLNFRSSPRIRKMLVSVKSELDA